MRYVYLAFMIGAIAAAAAGLEFIFEISGGSLSIHRMSGAGLVILYALILLLLLLFMTVFSPISAASYVRLYWARRLRAASGFFVMFCFGAVGVLILYATLAMAGQLTWSADGWRHIAPLGVLTGCAVAITEEIVFRGFVLSFLRWSERTAVTVSAVLFSAFFFAVVHDFADPLNWLTASAFPLFVGLFLIGILLAVTYVVTGSLWCAIGLHAALLVTGRVLPRRDTIVIDYEPWWLGSGAGDLRMAPVVWVFFILVTIVIYAIRSPLRHWLSVESFVGMPLNKAPADRSGAASQVEYRATSS